MANRLYGGSATLIQPSLGGGTGIDPRCSVLGLCFGFRLLNPFVPAYSCIRPSHANSTEKKLVAQQEEEASLRAWISILSRPAYGRQNQPG